MSAEPRTVTLIRGDGIGPEVADAVVSILEAAGAPLSFEEVVVGREAEKRDGDPLPAARPRRRSARTGVALKGPVGTPIGKGFQSVNVRLRQTLELYANLRPVKNVPSVESRFQGVDLVVVRENTEDLYSGLEHTSFPASSSRSRSSPRPPRRASRASPSSTRARNGRRRVTAVHKANIMKLSDGLFLDCFRRVAEDYPDIVADDRIVDAAVHAAGDEARDLRRAAAREPLRRHRVGPRRRTRRRARARARRQPRDARRRSSRPCTAPRPTSPGQDKANPTALLMSAILMLRHLDLAGARRSGRDGAARERFAAGIKTPDLGGTGRDEGVREGRFERVRSASRRPRPLSTAPPSESSAPARRSCPSTFAWQPSRRPSPMS